ncbi:MAG: hypothetical protein AB1847_09165 [bacterium]
MDIFVFTYFRDYYLQLLQFLLLHELHAVEEEYLDSEKTSLPPDNFLAKIDNCLSTRQPWQ